MSEPDECGWRVRRPFVIGLLSVALLAALPTSAIGATVISKSHNTDVQFGVPYAELEYENPLSGTEVVAGYRILEWRDAEFVAGAPANQFDDWQSSGPGVITGTADEAWLTQGGQVLTTQTSVATRLVSIHLASDQYGGLARVRVDGQLVAELDMETLGAEETVFVLVGELALAEHTIEVLTPALAAPASEGIPPLVRLLGGAALDAKWYQPPEPANPDNLYYGWNELSVVGGRQIVADDWFCDSDQPVTAIRWWGSFLGWRGAEPPPNWTNDFVFTFWTDVPAGVDTEFSHPGRVVWEAKCDTANWRFAGWDFDPIAGSYEAAFEFYCELPVEDWFFQEPRENQIYWLSIAAFYGADPPGEYLWGWKARPRDPNSPAPDDAVRVFDPVWPTRGQVYTAGEPIYWPTRTESWDMAFELQYRPVKWAQPPALRGEEVCYFGWDEFSVYGAHQIVADDWFCETNRPVTAIYWWGSYQGWLDQVPPPEVPTGFHIGIWSDIPAGMDAPFSHPGDMIHEWRVPMDVVRQRWVGCDFHPDYGQESAFLYQFEIPVEQWFQQDPGSGIYWVSIAAVYGSGTCPCDGDVNRNGDLSSEDMAIVEGNIGCPVGQARGGVLFCNESDVNCDGVVDQTDVAIVECQLAAGWTDPSCCAGVIPPHPWGWKTRPHNADSPAPDDAVRILDPTAPQPGAVYRMGEEILDNAGNSWDAAFILATTEEPPFVKWSQPPVLYDPPDAYFGWDEVSIYNGSQIVADDWYCDDGAPLTDIHWWGSFVGWGERQPPSIQPAGFHVAIWTDVPASPDTFSHPGEVIWELRCVDPRMAFVGWDFYPGQPRVAPEATFRYSCEFPDGEEFRQELGGNIYWVSISAVYQEAPPHNYVWGWKTRPRDAESPAPDAAVVVDDPTGPGVGAMYVAGAPIYWPSPADSWDAAFVLTSGPPPIGACCYPDEVGYPCREIAQLECERTGGIYYGDDTVCGRRAACCLPNGTCRVTAEICCEGEGGWMPGSAVCLGDTNNNGVDDACDGPIQACCLPDATCADTTHMDCVLRGGDPQGPGTDCSGSSCRLLKWAQPPVLNPASPEPECFWGWDEDSHYQCCQIMADDFVCQGPKPITDIHWWGSYQLWGEREPPANAPDRFHIGIWTDVPAGGDADYSHPGVMVWDWVVPRDALNERSVGCDLFGDDVVIGPDTCFRYDFFIPEGEWFYQSTTTEQRIYWVSISAIYLNVEPPAEFAWGWKTRPRDPDSLAPDAAIKMLDPRAPSVGDAFVDGLPLITGAAAPIPWDLAFVLTTRDAIPPREACCFEDQSCQDLTRNDCIRQGGVPRGPGTDCSAAECPSFKWMQLPTTVAGDPDRCFWGWDEPSQYNGSQIVADDWMCQDGRPITDVHWWGSYLDWQETFPPRGGPEQFRIGIWTNAPDPVTPFSHPEQLIREWLVPRHMLNERPVGCDFHPDFGEPETCFQYDFIIPEDRWFYQESACAVYWISIAAEYTSGPPVIPWGWKTRQHFFEDDAIRILDPLAPQVGDRFQQGRPIEHPQGVSWDMAFALTSTKEVIYSKWSQYPGDPSINFDAASDIWLPQEEIPPTTKWEQAPNAEYPGVRAHDFYDGNVVRQLVAANDWLCEGGVVSDFHWWGAVVDRGEGIRGFHLSIHEGLNAPPPPGTPCVPGALLWERGVRIDDVVVTPTGVFNSAGLEIMRYDYDLRPDEWFPQERGRTYWFDVSAISQDPRAPYVWHWQESGRMSVPELCPSAVIDRPSTVGWQPIFWPDSDTYSELAFAVTSRDFPPEVNRVVADDFVSDGRPVTAVRWWGSYLDERYAPEGVADPEHVLDGWLLTFHWADVNAEPGCPPNLMVDPPPTALGVYFAPADAVEILGIDSQDCLGHALYEYTVNLDSCCLLCSEIDPRSDVPEGPAQQRAFFEIGGFRYWLSIQAVVGTEWVPPACDRVRTGHLPSDLFGNAGHFWGWHSTDRGGLDTACTGRIADFSPYPPTCWDYGMWKKQLNECPIGELPPLVHMSFQLLTNAPDVTGPHIVHMTGHLGHTRPCTGYIDPRLESDNGTTVNMGVDKLTVVFSEPVFAPGGAPVGPADFVVTETGAAGTPNPVAAVTQVNPITYDLDLTRIITLQEWTTVRAVVEDGTGNPISNMGDLGPGTPEPDRIDLAFLPCDIDQDGLVEPQDLIRLRQFLTAGLYHNACADDLYFDIDRDAIMPEPQDLLRFRQMIAGTPPATRSWSLQTMNHPQP